MFPKANIIVGLGYGDEGKGLYTDYLCSQYSKDSTIVIRYNGGQQAGHTVVIGDQRHVHANVCSGALRGYKSYISKYCTMWLPSMLNELSILRNIPGTCTKIDISSETILTTHYDIAWNHITERINRHGSCGYGVGAAMKRHHESPYKLYARDLLYPEILLTKLKEHLTYYKQKLKDFDVTIQDSFSEIAASYECELYNAIDLLSEYDINITSELPIANNYIFEGAQGIMLDMNYGVFPHVTYSNTTSKNALELCKELNINDDNITMNYVTRCYQTRHGNGPMTSLQEIKLQNNEAETNVHNEWQTNFRTAELDVAALEYALSVDSVISKYNSNILITCMDQILLAGNAYSDLFQFLLKYFKDGQCYGSFGPTALNVSAMKLITD